MDASPAAAPTRPGARLAWRALACLTALHVALMLASSLLHPAFAGFDETQHVDAVLSIRHGDGWPAPQQRQLSEGIVRVATPVLQSIQELPLEEDELAPRGTRPSIASLGVERDSTGQVLPNQITQHPPLYYAVGAAVLAVVPGSSDWAYDRTVAVLRLVSVVLMAPLPLLAWATARALGGSGRAALGAAALSLAAPQLERVGGSVNNDALYTLTFAATLLLLVRVASGDLRRRTVLGAGLLAGLALLTKGFALVLPLAVVLSFLAARLRTGRRDAWRSGLLCLVVAFVVGGWWWLRNLVLYGTVQPAGWPDRYLEVLGIVPRSPDEPAPLLPFVRGAFSRLSERFWGGLEINYNGPDTFPVELTTLLTLVTAAAFVAAVVRLRPARPALVAAVLVPFLSVLGLVLFNMWQSYDYGLAYSGAQGRYLFGSLPSLAAAAALGLAAVAGRARRLLLPAAAALAVLMHARGAYRVWELTWVPDEGLPIGERYGRALDALLAWSPWPQAVTAVLLVAPVVGAGLVLVLVVRCAVDEDEVRPPLPAGEPVP